MPLSFVQYIKCRKLFSFLDWHSENTLDYNLAFLCIHVYSTKHSSYTYTEVFPIHGGNIWCYRFHITFFPTYLAHYGFSQKRKIQIRETYFEFPPYFTGKNSEEILWILHLQYTYTFCIKCIWCTVLSITVLRPLPAFWVEFWRWALLGTQNKGLLIISSCTIYNSGYKCQEIEQRKKCPILSNWNCTHPFCVECT